jgi:hypothetical protein
MTKAYLSLYKQALPKNVLILPISLPRFCVNLNMDALFLRRYSVEVCEKTPSPLLVRNKGLTLAVRQSSGQSFRQNIKNILKHHHGLSEGVKGNEQGVVNGLWSTTGFRAGVRIG